ncbi:MAG: Uma2 family endonuclease [Anaerolineae bacterium]|nr:Uma2 family endonuclease [Thermoflexales bacterium]MCX7938526.1 Uma2 family endonuclease [Thermoflexales bacterium]MDW8053324.1 Uma2 family endonuclease [Anaerolineae bacterium]MDW8291975.1 Uma2 family endonuclease [Anaerolineae bacterium]
MVTQSTPALQAQPAEISEAELRALASLKLLDEDGVPLENAWHRLQINLFEDSLRQFWRGRTDFYIAGNMFLYYNLEQAQTHYYRGPDLFVVKDVDGTRPRPYWAVWLEGGRAPNLIVELLSESTRREDLGTKKELYERVLRVPEYVCYGPDPTQSTALEFYLWRLDGERYREVSANEQGWKWSEVLGAWLGVWEGEYNGMRTRWLRLYDRDGQLVLNTAELLERERQRAEAERQRAEAAEQRAAQLAARLRALGVEDV